MICVLHFQLNAQNREIIISGNLTGNKYKKPISNALVKLVCSDTTTLQTYSDSLGKYSFKKTINKKTEAVIAIYPTALKPYGNCPFSYKNHVMTFTEKVKLTIYPDTLNNPIIKDIFVSEGDIDYNFPGFVYFKKNGDEFSSNEKEYFYADTTLDCIVDLLQTYPKYNLTISGYSNKNEKNKQQLSEQRAKKVYDLLVKKGIELKRLSYKGCGATATSIEPDEPEKTIVNNNSKVQFQISRSDK